MIQNHKPPMLALSLFGPLEIRVHGAPLPRLHSRKVAWLLALLTLRHGKPVERDWLVGTLWPDSTESQALAYLRQGLTELRRAFQTEAARLQTPTRHTLALDLSGATVDLLTFDTGILKGDLPSLARAVEVYRGPLLEGCTEEWVLQERAVREQSYLTALQRLAHDALANKEAGIAADYLRRAVAVDPLREGAQRALMQALVMEGHFAAATQVYRDLRLHLHRELHAEPDPQTTAVYDQIRVQTREKAQVVPEVAQKRSSSPPPRRLPHPLTDLVGREAEIPQIAARMRQGRLLTLTGPGGVGKTRLAIAVAEEMAEEYPDGAFFVDLAPLSDPTFLAQTMASALQVREEARRPLLATLQDYLQSRTLLLLLDNCEHLLEGCAALADGILQNCANVSILATSRQALGLTGEVRWQVPSLCTPTFKMLAHRARYSQKEWLTPLSEYEAVQLFVRRAQQVLPSFQMDLHNAEAVARVCAHLDGIPLALELAAARVRSLSVEEIHNRLDNRFRLLTDGSRTALPRQQTLRALMDWSYDLLNAQERTLLCRLAVFAGGWTLDAAEQVCSIEGWEVFDLLTSLVDKNLVVAEPEEAHTRYRLLETVRQYALDRLAEREEGDEAHRRHQAFYLAFSEEAEPQLTGPEGALWLDRLEQEHDNLRQALEEGCQEAALRLASALGRFWRVRGYCTEGRQRLADMLGGDRVPTQAPARAKALNSAGVLAHIQGDYAAAQALHEQSLALYRELEDKQGIANCLLNLGNDTGRQGDLAAARPLYEQSLTLFQELGDKEGIADYFLNLGTVVNRYGDPTAARPLYEKGLALFQELGHKGGIANALDNLGTIAFEQGDLAAARSLCEQSLALKRELKNKPGIANSLLNLGNVAFEQGEYTTARPLYEQSLALYQELGDKRGGATSLLNLGAVAFEQGDYTAAQALQEQSLALYRKSGNRRDMALVLENLGNVAFEQGEYTSARALYAQSLALYRDMGNKRDIIYPLEGFAALASVQEKVEHATRLWGATEALREKLEAPLRPSEHTRYDRHVGQSHAALSEEAFTTAWSEGRALTVEQAIEYALLL